MKTVSSAFINKMSDTLRTYVPRMTINGQEIGGDIMDGLTINLGSLGADNSLVGGVVFVPSFSATIRNCETSLQNKEIKLEMGLVLDDDSVEYVDIGYFTVEKPSTNKYQTSFTAYGRLASQMGRNYTSALNYPATVGAIVNEIASQSGLTIRLNGFTTESSLQIPKPFGVVSCRDALGIVAGVIGGYVTEASDGSIVVAKFTNTVQETVTTSVCYSLPSSQDDEWVATGISVEVPSDIEDDESEPVVYSYGSPVNVSYSSQWMTSSLFEAVKRNIYGYRYKPTEVTFLGDIRLEPWDAIKVFDGSDNEGIVVPCMNILHAWDGGLVTTITAPANTTAEEESGFGGALSQQIDDMRAQIGRFGTVIADKVQTKVLESDELTAKVADIADAKIDNLEVNSINGNAIRNSAVLAKALSQEMVETVLGVKVFYQATQPTANKVGDIWYKTLSDKFDPKNDPVLQWDGTTWSPVEQDVPSVFMANSIIAQDINTNSLASSQAFIDTLETNFQRVGDVDGKHIDLTSDGITFHDKYFPNIAKLGYETTLGIDGSVRTTFSAGRQRMVDAQGNTIFYIGGDFDLNHTLAFFRYEYANLTNPVYVRQFVGDDAVLENVTGIDVRQGNVKLPSSRITTYKLGNSLVAEFNPPLDPNDGRSVEFTVYGVTSDRFIMELDGDAEIGGEVKADSFSAPLITLNPTYTRTSGTAKSNVEIEAYRFGQVVHVRASFGLYTTSAGGDMAVGTISGIPKPIAEIKASAYNGARSAIMALTTSRGVTVRCQDAVTTTSSNYIFGFTYLTED